jgi:hypothetical protein
VAALVTSHLRISLCALYLMRDEQVTLAELAINIVAWISVPNEAHDLYKKLIISPERGLLASRSVNAARRTRASFEPSIRYT